MAVVASPISRIVADSTFLRPNRSPRWPKKRPPIGRTTNAMANTANAETVAAALSPDGKNKRPIVDAR